MDKAYIDTTIIANVLLKSGKASSSSARALEAFSHTQLPQYAIKEFKAGPLSKFIWMHNVLIDGNSFFNALDRLHAVSRTPQKYHTSTAIEALRECVSDLRDEQSGSLISQYGEEANLDIILADKFKLHLKYRIVQAWNKRRLITNEVVHEAPCYPESEIRYKDGSRIENGKTTCDDSKGCWLATKMAKKQDQIQKIIDSISDSDRSEDHRRSSILKEMVRKKNFKVDNKGCRRLGDAFFAFYCPNDAIILTTNIKDHKKLAQALGKDAISPDELLDLNSKNTEL